MKGNKINQNMDFQKIHNISVSINNNKGRNSQKTIITSESSDNCKINELNSYSDYETNLDPIMLGFPNIGYSCYMNSFLQILFHTPFFLSLLKKNYQEKEEDATLIDCLISLSECPKNIYILRSIKELMGKLDQNFSRNIQKDSQYFGIMLINEIISLLKDNIYKDDQDNNDDYNGFDSNGEVSVLKIEKKKGALFQDYIKKYFNKKNETFVEKMFQFHESKIKIDKEQLSNNLKIKKIEFETFLSIDLFFPSEKNSQKYNINDLLRNKYSPLSILGKELPKINKTNNKIIDSLKNLKNFIFNNNNDYNNESDISKNKNIIIKRIYSLPNILILTINRMIFGKALNNSKLIIDEKLDLKDFVDENVNEKNTSYSLYGINECYKYKVKFGHNYSYIKINNKWFLFDDAKVLESEPDFESKYVVGLYYVRDNFQDIILNI